MKKLNFHKTEVPPLHSYFQAKRLIQIYWAVEITLFVVFIQRLYLEEFFHAAMIFITGIILIGVYKLARKDKVSKAATFLLSILTIFVTYFMWANSGIYDEVLLAYPCILIMAAMLENKKLFVGLFFIMSLSIILNGISNQQEWYINSVNPIDIKNSILVLLII